jgi:hypothetical protein
MPRGLRGGRRCAVRGKGAARGQKGCVVCGMEGHGVLYAVDRVCSPVHTCSTCRARAAGRCVACEHNQSKMELQRHCAEWVQRSATHVYCKAHGQQNLPPGALCHVWRGREAHLYVQRCGLGVRPSPSLTSSSGERHYTHERRGSLREGNTTSRRNTHSAKVHCPSWSLQRYICPTHSYSLSRVG